MNEDIGFDNDASKRDAKKGRRAQPAKAPATPEFESTGNQSPQNTHAEASDDGPPKPNRVSGWGEDAPKRPRRAPGTGMETFEDEIFQGLDIESEMAKIADRSRRSRGQKSGWQTEADERLRPHTPESEGSDNDIPVIPDLEDQQEEDITQTIASAPNVAVNRVATYKELDNDLLKQAAFLTLDGEIDLKLLTKSLSTEADLVEEDKPWDWDRLFTEVTSELLTQWEKSDGEVGESAGETNQQPITA
ncbi:intraflagellar transport protein 43 homolog A-like isoform X1 [Dreissena polymorpha]|uniref:intraflagellar transport protein 43 homolog A-like isoform X1 n=1 Tax=Dreissena polymorpha TaxID=45954 RepID=UPI002263B5A3|nr:intraflagellar transport protein 43 homolog A-like isoform X1 [Dreissena polymorpha]